MKKFTTLFVSLALVLSAAGATFVTASQTAGATAAKPASACEVVRVGSNDAGKPNSKFTLNKNGTVTAKFKVTGQKCTAVVTLVAWEAPNGTDGMPYSAQKHFSHKTATFKPGDHTITTKLPDCYYQVDLITGSKWDSFPATTYSSQGILRGHLHGGTKACTTKPPVTPPTTPTTPETPEVEAKDVPEQLPNTGAGTAAMIVTTLGSAAASTLGFRRFLSRRIV